MTPSAAPSVTPSAEPSRRALYWIALAALLTRLAIWPWFAGVEPRIYDEDDYVDLATNLAETGEYKMDGRISTARPPLYPAMVSVIYRVAGTGNHQAVRLFQIVLNIAIVPLVYALGRRLYDPRTGLVAAAIAAFYPSLWGHDYLILTEVLFTVLLTAGTLALVEHVARPRWPLLVAAGVAFGLGTLTRTTLLFYPPFLAIALFAWWRAESPRRIAAVTVFSLAFALTVAPWIARNTMLLGQLSSVDSFSTYTAARFSPLRHLIEGGDVRATPPGWKAAYGRAEGAKKAAGGETRAGHEGKEKKETKDRKEKKEKQEKKEPTSGIVRMITDTTWDTLLFWRIDRELAGAASKGWLGPIPRPVVLALAIAIAGYYAALVLAGAVGLVLRPPAEAVQLAIVLSVVVLLTAVHAFSFGHSRYHIPLMPLFALFAARFWVARREPVALRRRLAALAVAAVVIAGWTATFVRFDLYDVRGLVKSESSAGGAPRLH